MADKTNNLNIFLTDIADTLRTNKVLPTGVKVGGSGTDKDKIYAQKFADAIKGGVGANVPNATTSKTDATASATANAGTASITKQPGASASASASQTGMTDGVSSTATNYYFTSSARASSNSGVVTATGGSAQASVTASSASVSAGYASAATSTSTAAKDTGLKTGNTATTTEATASKSDSSTVYLKAAGCSVTGGGLSKETATGGGLSGGGLSGGGLTDLGGEVSVSNSTVTPKIDRSYTVSGATDATYGVTTTQPTSGNYATLDPNATVTANGTAKGRGSVRRGGVTRGKIDRAAFSQKVNRAAVTDTHTAGYLPAGSSTPIAAASETVSLTADSIAADTTTIPQADKTTAWSDTKSTNPTIAAGTNVYIPVVGATATATGGTASASASIAKDPTASASASQTGMTDGVSTTATNYYFTSSASAASGYSTASASATGGSASASVGKGLTAGDSKSADGAASGEKSATSTEKTASDSSKVYLKAATCTVAGGGVSGGGLTAGTGEVSITTTPVVTVSESGTFCDSTVMSNFGITTTKPTGTDGTNYVSIDGSGSVTTAGKAKGRGSVSRAKVTRAAVTDAHTAGYLPAKTATTVIAADDGATIGATSGTSNWSTESTITPTITDNFEPYYIPVVTPAFDGGGMTGNDIGGSKTAGTVTLAESGTFFTSSGYGVTTTKPSGTDGTNYLTVHETHSATAGPATGSTTITRAAVQYNGAKKGLVNIADDTTALSSGTKTVNASISVTPSVTDNFEPYYVPVAAASATAGTASASAGTASITKQPSASASASASQTGMTDGVSTDATSYYFTSSASASAASGVVTATGGSASATGGNASVSAGITKGASATGANSGQKTGNTATTTEQTASKSDSSKIYLKAATCTVEGGGLSKGTASGGRLSGGGLTAGAGEVSITTTPKVTPSIGGTGVSSTAQTNYGVTTTKPSGTDGTDYITLDPDASVTTTGKAKGRGSVSRAAVTRAAFSQTVSRAAVTDAHTAGYLPAKTAATVIAADSSTVSLAADSTTIGATSGTSNWSADSNITPGVEAGTNWYIPVSAASATAGTASASASIAKDPSASASASASQTGMADGVSSTATSYYFTSSASASAASGYSTASASATGGSASVTKGVTSGASASGQASGNKSATSTEKTASDSDSSTVYLKAAGHAVSGSVTNATATTTVEPGSVTIAAATGGNVSSTPTTTKPNSGKYIAVAASAAANTTGTTSSITGSGTAKDVTTAGYDGGNSTGYTGDITVSGTATAKTSKKDSSTYYLPVATTNVVEKAGTLNTTAKTYTQGKVTVDTAGWIDTGDKVAGATFANSATSGVTYKDISSTSAAPVLVTQDYLYINKGYTDNVKISLAKLVPDGASADLASGDILSGKSAYDSDGKLIAGNIPTQTDSGNVTLNGTTTSKSYPAGYYPNAHGAEHATVNIPDPTMSFDATTKQVTASGSWTKGFTTDDSYTKSYTVTLENAKAVTGTGSAAVAGGALSGGGLSEGDGSLVAYSNCELEDTNNSGICLIGRGTVNRAAITRGAITRKYTAGYVAGDATAQTVIDADTIAADSLQSASKAGYLRTATVASGKTLAGFFNNGTVTAMTNTPTGVIGWMSNEGTITIDQSRSASGYSHREDGIINISNIGTVNIYNNTDATHPGTVQIFENQALTRIDLNTTAGNTELLENDGIVKLSNRRGVAVAAVEHENSDHTWSTTDELISVEREKVEVTARRLVSDSYASHDSYETINIVNTSGVFNRAVQNYSVSGLSGSVATAPEPGAVSVSSDSTTITNKIRIPSSPKTSNTFSEKYYIAVKPSVASTDVTMAAAVSGLVNMSVGLAGVVTSTDAANAPFSEQNASISTTIAGKWGNVTYLPVKAATWSSDIETSTSSTGIELLSSGWINEDKYLTSVRIPSGKSLFLYNEQLSTYYGISVQGTNPAELNTEFGTGTYTISSSPYPGSSTQLLATTGIFNGVAFVGTSQISSLILGSPTSYVGTAYVFGDGIDNLIIGQPSDHSGPEAAGTHGEVNDIVLTDSGEIDNLYVAGRSSMDYDIKHLWLGYNSDTEQSNTAGAVIDVVTTGDNDSYIKQLVREGSDSALNISDNRGRLFINHTTNSGDVYVRPNGVNFSIHVIRNGVFYPFVDVPSASALYGYITDIKTTGIYFKYTGSNTHYTASDGITYYFINGTLYTYGG